MQYNQLITFVLLVFFTACSSGVKEGAIPEDLEGKKTFLKEKRKELSDLKKLITQIETEIEEQTPDELKIDKSRLVTVETLSATTFKHYSDIQGSVMAEDMVDASSEIGGRLISLKVREGQSVRKGQLIAIVDVEGVDKQLGELDKSIELAQTVFDRQSRLWKQNIGSEIQYLQAKNTLERLQKNRELLLLQKDKTNVYAPISGEVEKVIVHAGELTSPGMPIVMLLNTTKLKAVVDLPESYLTKVKKGQKVKIKFPVLDQQLELPITKVANMINPANRTFRIEVNLGNRKSKMKPNLLAVVSINDLTVKDAITIPSELVQQEVGGLFYVLTTKVEGDKTVAAKKYVESGKSFDGNILIEKGLEAGDQIIMKGALGLTEGESVKIVKN